MFFVYSHGGVGSKQLVKWLYPHSGQAVWAAAHRHDPTPPPTVPEGSRLVYVFGDPRDAAISIFQRRERRHERHGFARRPPGEGERSAPDFAVRHAHNLGSDPAPMDSSWGLADFAMNRRDLFGFERHFDAWRNVDAGYPIVFARYETLADQLDALLAYLALDPQPVTFRPRAANWNAQSPDVQTALNAIYVPMLSKIAALPDLFVLQQGTVRPLASVGD